VRPLYYGFIGDTLFAASEIKALPPNATDVQAFPPGHVGVYNPKTGELALKRYHSIPWVKNENYEFVVCAVQQLKYALEAAVEKRLMTERPIAALLSGGLDSSLIAALVQRSLKRQGRAPLETYSIGFPGSSDLKYARMVAKYIGSVHHEIVSSPEEFFAAIPEVIKAIESPDITSVRASVGNYLVSKYIRENSPSDAKVVFNGDGSDEVFGSYLYFYNAPTDEAFEAEIDRLLTDIHHFDVLRSDRCIASNGLEPRTPFLDKQFVAVARAIPTRYLRPSSDQIEKFLIRQAFADWGLLPREVLLRRKEAFSDGVSGPQKAWYEEVQDRVVAAAAASGLVLPTKEELEAKYPHLTPRTLEAYYYRQIYDSNYNHLCIPYYWLPRWSGETNDPSARTLKVYSTESTEYNILKGKSY
jgi:asparagine synthase (glutamine-hydrolysing)